jgi:hypothetical protein
MDYAGKYAVFDFSQVETYPIGERPNKVRAEDLVVPEDVARSQIPYQDEALDEVAQHIKDARSKDCPVIWMMGAHPVKLGLAPLVNDLIRRDMITLVATNGAGAIHDFELALIGQTSESVPNALPEGRFGMAYETGTYMNDAMVHGHSFRLGLGESLARMIRGEPFPYPVEFPHRAFSFLCTGYEEDVPVTVHATVGTDITDQHPNFDGAAKGGCSGRDFGIYAGEVCRLTDGGVVLNIGSAVTGPEVFLKSVSMAANVGRAPQGIITADFDIRPVNFDHMADESKFSYYFRNAKSVVTRIPEAFGGRGYYVRGHFSETIPALYQRLVN